MEVMSIMTQKDVTPIVTRNNLSASSPSDLCLNEKYHINTKITMPQHCTCIFISLFPAISYSYKLSLLYDMAPFCHSIQFMRVLPHYCELSNSLDIPCRKVKIVSQGRYASDKHCIKNRLSQTLKHCNRLISYFQTVYFML